MSADAPRATPGNPFANFHLRGGAPPPEVVARSRMAESVRALLHEVLSTSAPVEELEEVHGLLERAVARLAERGHSRRYEGPAEGALAERPGTFLDRSPIIGDLNAIARPMRMTIEGDGGTGSVVVGRVEFGDPYEGPPGCVHGGFIAAYFDEVVGMAQSLSGNPGMTVHLEVDYRAPTPLHRPLEFRGWVVAIEGRKIHVAGSLHHGGTLCAEAKGLFVSMRPEVFARLMALRESQSGASAD